MASELIAWLHSKTLILALIREVQVVLPRIKCIKAVIRAVLTWWTMHYQSYHRLGELHDIIVMVVNDDVKRPVQEHHMIRGDVKARAKAEVMVKLIENTGFWNALAVYVVRWNVCRNQTSNC